MGSAQSRGRGSPVRSPPAPTLLSIPPEVRLRIYEFYMLDYIKTCPQAFQITLSCGYGRQISLEDPANPTLALMLVCRLITREFGPVSAQYIRFVIGNFAGVNDARHLAPGGVLPLPARCRSGWLSGLRHLQIEWRVRNVMVDMFRLDAAFMAPPAECIRLFLTQHDRNGGDGSQQQQQQVKIETLEIIVATPPDYCPWGFYSEAVIGEKVEQMFMTMQHCPALKVVNLVGTFERALLDRLEGLASTRGVKLVRGRAHPWFQEHEICD